MRAQDLLWRGVAVFCMAAASVGALAEGMPSTTQLFTAGAVPTDALRAMQSSIKAGTTQAQPSPDAKPTPDQLSKQSPADKVDVPREKSPPSEFQLLVEQSTGKKLPVFGEELFAGAPTTFAPVDRIPVTADYVIGPGDEIMLRVWGKVDMDLKLPVDRNGSVFIPEVGNVSVAGVTYQNLNEHLTKAIGRVLRNFELNASLGQLRSIQIFVVGQARRPGSYTISSLSTLVNALFVSGGPSNKGSMRQIQVKRGNRVVTTFDLYDLILKGDKTKDVQLLPGDVIYIPPVGPQVAISGSVNVPAIYEIREKSTFSDLIGLAGGLTTTASGQKATVERIDNRKARTVDEVSLDQKGLSRELRDGDLVQVFAISPRFENVVTLRGQVAAPLRYRWHEGMRIRDLIPNKDALITSDYWLRQNQATGVRLVGGAAVRTDVKRNMAEINWDYAVIERLRKDDLTTTLIPFDLGKAVLGNDPENNLPLQPGDVVTVFSKEDIQVPVAKQSRYVRLEGEVNHPGIYQTEPGETLRQLLVRVGGVTPNAYLYGAEFTRESVRIAQQKKMDQVLDRMEREGERAASQKARNAVSPEDAAAAKTQLESQKALIARLRQVKATGRVVLEIPPGGADRVMALPADLTLEDGDRFYVPATPSTVGVLGAVYNENAFVYQSGKRLSDYLAQAGGPTRDADESSIYVIKADGSVSSRRQSSWFSGFNGDRLMPGDTVVVPEDFDKVSWMKEIKDWTQIIYQMALGGAAIKVLRQ